MPNKKQNIKLEQLVYEALKTYFEQHEGVLPPPGLYDRVMAEVERPLLFLTLQLVDGNQRKAASILGLSRNTLRKKMTDLIQLGDRADRLKKLATSI
ncbi:MAG: hypothetical protein LBQ43_01040 [Holosporales bacterium]|nr:hypothetical protein [Holosporales bacterium]